MSGRRILRVGLAGFAVLVVAVVAGALWLKLAPRRVPVGQPALAALEPASLAAFRETFNEKDGVRLLVLLSPT